MTYIRKNQDIWDRRSANDDRWSIPVSAEEIKLAREGVWHIVLTPAKPVPADWFPDSLAGFGNPISCIFDVGKFERGILEVKHRIPYADVEHLDDPEIRAIAEATAICGATPWRIRSRARLRPALPSSDFMRTSAAARWIPTSIHRWRQGPSSCDVPGK